MRTITIFTVIISETGKWPDTVTQVEGVYTRQTNQCRRKNCKASLFLISKVAGRNGVCR